MWDSSWFSLPEASSQKPEALLSPLFQKPHIPLKELLNVIDAVLHHRHALHAHAEGEAADISSDRIRGASRSRRRPGRPCPHPGSRSIHSACTDGSPSPLPPQNGQLIMTSALGSVNGKNEGRKGLHRRAEHRLHGVVERALEIAEGDVGVHARPSTWWKTGECVASASFR